MTRSLFSLILLLHATTDGFVARRRDAARQPARARREPALAAKKRSSPSSKGPGAPRRITSDSVKRSGGMGLRTQLSLVRQVKKGPTPTTREAKKRHAGRAAPKNETTANATSALYDRALLVVDGYNCVFGDATLKKVSEAAGLDVARERLVAGCDAVATLRNWDCVVVFDAPETQEDRSEEARSSRTSVVFTDARESADAYIENLAAERRPLGDGATVVATNDQMIRLMAGASDAGCIRVDALMDLVAGAEQATSARLAAGRLANALARDASGEYDVLADLATRHTGEETKKRDAALAASRADVRALLKAVAAGRRPEDVARLAELERTMSAAERGVFDGDKRLLGLFDLLGEGWWEEATG